MLVGRYPGYYMMENGSYGNLRWMISVLTLFRSLQQPFSRHWLSLSCLGLFLLGMTWIRIKTLKSIVGHQARLLDKKFTRNVSAYEMRCPKTCLSYTRSGLLKKQWSYQMMPKGCQMRRKLIHSILTGYSADWWIVLLRCDPEKDRSG